MDVEPADELAAGDLAELLADGVVARALVEDAAAAGEGVGAGAGRADAGVDGVRERPPALGELRGGLADGRARTAQDLDLRGGQLELEPLVAGPDRLQRLRPGGREVQRLGVEQHQLLLEPDGHRALALERRAQVGGGDHGGGG